MDSFRTQPNYRDGFAPHEGEPLHPGLRRGLVGDVVPTLGRSGPTLRDQSGRRNHAELSVNTTWTASHYGPAVRFPGSGSESAKFASPIDIQRSFSVVVLTRENSSASYHNAVVHHQETGDAYFWLAGRTSSRVIHARLNGTTGGTIYLGTYFPTFPIVTGTWYCVAFTFDAVPKTARLYVDGYEHDNKTDATVDVDTLPLLYGFGQRFLDGNHTGNTFEGDVAYLAVWHRVLSAAEVRCLASDPHALHRLAPTWPPLHRSRRPDGPLGVQEMDTFRAGGLAGEGFVPGNRRGNAFTAGQQVGQGA